MTIIKKNILIIFIILGAAIFVAGAFYLPVPSHLDFQVLYFTDLGFVNGIDIYDHSAQVEMIASLRGVTSDQVFVLPFPYPPWYVLSTFFLAWIPQDIASRIWFELNFVMLMLSVWLLTDGWNAKLRLASFLATIIYIPVVGSLYVGQYNFPVFLGSALLVYALRKENVTLTTIAFSLLTFKPHLGGPLALIMLLFLITYRTEFAKQAVKAILFTALFLFVTGFIADSAWPLNYVKALVGFQSIPSDVGCFICASMPIAIYHLFTGQMAMTPGFIIGGVSFLLLFIILYSFRRDILLSPIQLFSASILIILLSAPYIFNYDYLLLLVPIFLLAESDHKLKWIWMTLAYLFPQALIAFLGRDANLLLPLTALFVLIILALQPRIEKREEVAFVLQKG
jgi:hypothetical protein